MLKLFMPAIIAAIVAAALTPLVRRWAQWTRFVDRPDGGRKVQSKPVALGGGIGLYVGLLAGSAVGVWANFAVLKGEFGGWGLVGLLAASALLCAVGVVDDRRAMPGKYKLLWQVLAASIIIGSGVVIDKVSIFGLPVDLGLFGAMLTMIWLLAAINSINLIDGVDGLAASVGLVFSLSLGLMALMFGHVAEAIIAFAMAGALVGLLPFNLPPAKIYLGDAGSMLIGLVLGVLALKCSFKEAATVAFAAPLARWAIPIFDSAIAILRCTLTGRSVYTSDRGHIHHRLLTRGFSPPQALLIVAGLCTVTSSGALASVYFRSEAIGLAVVAVVIIALVGTRVFGHVELLLLNNRLLGIGRLLSPAGESAQSHHDSVRLQGTLGWERLWDALVESADRFGVCQIQVNLNVPRLHEDFYATWSRGRAADSERSWHLNLPIRLGEAHVGRLRVTGERTWGSITDQLQEFLDFVEALQQQLPGIVEPRPSTAADETLRDDASESISSSPYVHAPEETALPTQISR